MGIVSGILLSIIAAWHDNTAPQTHALHQICYFDLCRGSRPSQNDPTRIPEASRLRLPFSASRLATSRVLGPD